MTSRHWLYSYHLSRRYLIRYVAKSELSSFPKMVTSKAFFTTSHLSSKFITDDADDNANSDQDEDPLENHKDLYFHDTKRFDQNLPSKAAELHIEGDTSVDDNLLQNEILSLHWKEKQNLLSDILLKKITSVSTVTDLLEILDKIPLDSCECFFAFINSLFDLHLQDGRTATFDDGQNEKILELFNRHLSVYLQMSDLLLLLKFLLEFNIQLDHGLNNLLQIIHARSFEMTLKDIIHFSRIAHGYSKNLQLTSVLRVQALVIQKLITGEALKPLPPDQLIKLLDYCSQYDVVGVAAVLKEISSRKWTSGFHNLSILCNILNISTEPIRKLLLPIKESELMLKFLARTHFDYIARNIQEFSPYEIDGVLLRAANGFKKNLSFAYNENFLNAIATSDFLSGSDLLHYMTTIDYLTSMKYVNATLLNKVVQLIRILPDDIPGFSASLLTGLSCSEIKPEGLHEILDLFEAEVIKKELLHNFALPWPLKIIEFLSMDYVPKRILHHFYTWGLLEKYLDYNLRMRSSTINNRLEELALLEYFLRMKDPLTPYRLPPYVSEMVRSYLMKPMRKGHNKFHAWLNDTLGPDCIAKSVILKNSLQLDYLVVVNERGVPLPIFPSNSPHKVSFESLHIDEGVRKIVIHDITERNVYNPDKKITALVQIQKQTLEMEGFEVLMCCREHNIRQSRLAHKNILLEAGISLE